MNPCAHLDPSEVLLGDHEPEMRQCRKCGRFYDARNGMLIPSPFLAVNVSEGICQPCYMPKLANLVLR